MDFSLFAKVLFLGIVEGLTEFLPISSTGHLIILGDIIDYTGDPSSKVFKIVVQLGAILAICWHYRVRLFSAIKNAPNNKTERHFLSLLIVGFLPAAFFGALLHSVIKNYLFHPIVVATALIVGGFIILWVERRAFSPRILAVNDMKFWDAIKVGLMQCLAMCPGVSRSGATIIGGMFLGLSRKTATEFSFFLAIPTMFGATFYDIYKNWDILNSGDFLAFAVGFVASFLAAVLTVNALLKFVANHTYNIFAYYRIAFGGFVLLSMPWIQWAN